jgi:hypothetical protein
LNIKKSYTPPKITTQGYQDRSSLSAVGTADDFGEGDLSMSKMLLIAWIVLGTATIFAGVYAATIASQPAYAANASC